MKKVFLLLAVSLMFSCAARMPHSNTPRSSEINKFSDGNQTKSEKKDIVTTSEGEKVVVHVDTTARHTPQSDITDIITGEHLVEPVEPAVPEKNVAPTENIRLNLNEPKKKDSPHQEQKAAEPAKKVSSHEPSRRLFAVQAGVFSELSRADEVRFFIEEVLQKNGRTHDVFLVIHDKHYKVQIGNLPNRQQADNIVNLLQSNGYNSFVVLPSSN